WDHGADTLILTLFFLGTSHTETKTPRGIMGRLLSINLQSDVKLSLVFFSGRSMQASAMLFNLEFCE
ncbi:hypothetical protein, partial [Vibrio anguillarum]|uniref:hypothetical protein n=1 Tax=Vibrio anguillarum TaxID=55601 RepID=UPI001BE491E4